MICLSVVLSGVRSAPQLLSATQRPIAILSESSVHDLDGNYRWQWVFLMCKKNLEVNACCIVVHSLQLEWNESAIKFSCVTWKWENEISDRCELLIQISIQIDSSSIIMGVICISLVNYFILKFEIALICILHLLLCVRWGNSKQQFSPHHH